MIIAPPAFVTPIMPNIIAPHTRVHGTIRLNTPTLSATTVGSTRPKALDALRMESLTLLSVSTLDPLNCATHGVESQRLVDAVFYRI